MERRLAAILAADMVAYSRLMEADEAGTLAALKALRAELIDPQIAAHQGRIVKTTGDGLLAEFASVVDAVTGAVAIQRAMAGRNEGVPEDRRIRFRVGINLGDIIIDGDDIYGDGVNIAARLEALAEPGGICVSGAAHEQLKAKVDVGYEDLGEQRVKNIAIPVRVYRVLLDPQAAGRVSVATSTRLRRWSRPAAGATAVVAALLAAGYFGVFPIRPAGPDVEPASVARMAFPLPEKPSIAVLPFDNLSGDPAQDYLGDGITENIISSLSKVSEMLVIARNSTFTYKGKPVKVQQVAEELGVRYVLEGSVQTSGDQLRVTAQLIDAVEGHHLWSERYDRRMEELFAVQDDITREIVVAMQVKLTEGEQARVRAKSTNNLQAWGYAVRGSSLAVRVTKEDNTRARELFERAVELDPNYAWAWAMIARTHWYDARFGYSTSRAESARKAVENVRKALALDPEDAEAHALMGGIHLSRREYDKALAEGRKALELGPNMAQVKATVAFTMRNLGEWDETIALSKSAMRAHPSYPSWYLLQPGIAYTFKGEFASAIATLERALRRAESNFMKASFHVVLADAHSEAGHEDEARRHMAEALTLNPAFSAQFMRRITSYKNPAHLERMLASLRKAGLPENPPLKLPDKPSIAVLPFTNMSGDAEQEYFADGMTEDLITDLSKVSGLFVIARNSSFQYKGKSPDVRTVGRDLGVKYVLEGSVRRVGDRVRINAQLVDVGTGGHLWAERYDGNLSDVFALQDRVTEKVVAALAVKITAGERKQAARKETESAEAYDAFLQGWAHFQRFTPDDAAAAIPYFERAIALDPTYGRAHAALALTYWEAMESRWYLRLGLSLGEALDKAKEYLARAMEEPTALARRVNADMLVGRKRYDAAIEEAERAIAMEPNSPDGYLALAEVLVLKGEPKKALDAVGKAKRLDPLNPHLYDFWGGVALLQLERFEESAATLRRVVALNPEAMWSHVLLVAVYGHLGRKDEARVAIERLDAIRRKMGLGGASMIMVEIWRLKNPADKQRLRDGLRLAGLPALPGELPTRPQDRLRSDDLRVLLLGGRWWYGRDPRSDADYWFFRPKKGEIEMGGALGSDRGRSYVEGDQICVDWTTFGPVCAEYYRNLEGTHENNDEYIVNLPMGVYSFSTYKERPPALKDR